ncbi:MAG: glycosyltransferase [Afipia felis]|nr:glycosyltransferase [Afipia felis]
MTAHEAPSPQDDVISSNPVIASRMAPRPDFLGEIDESRLIGHFRDDLTGGDKLTLQNFMVREFDLDQFEVLRDPAEIQPAIERHESLRTQLDMLCLDVAVLRECKPVLVARLLKLLSPKGILCIESSETAERIDADLLPAGVFESAMMAPGFSVFAQINGERAPRSVRYQIDLFRRKRYVERKRRARLAAGPKIPEVAVFILTYKHEAFIAECLRSVMKQRGHFTLRVLIIDDASPDNTAQVARTVIAENSDDRLKIELRVNPQNVGPSANWGPALSWAEGADYMTLCDGDDFWNSEYRIQEHINFLRRWPNAVMSFDSTASSSDASRYQAGVVAAEENLTGSNIIEDGPIVSPSSTFYRGEMAKVLPLESLLQISDNDDIWTFNIYCGQFGFIGRLNKTLTSSCSDRSITRRDPLWNVSRASNTVSAVAVRNALFDFNFRDEFRALNEVCYSVLGNLLSYSDGNSKKIDLIVLDDTFPTPKNGFRYLEFTSYLQEFSSSLVLSTGAATSLVDTTPHDSLIRNYQRKYPELGSRVAAKAGKFPLHLGKLIYIMFLHNTYAMLPEIEEAGVQFIFTLYPGGGFALNNPDVDRQLTRVFESPFFRTVIVTQQVIYQYIVRKGLCPAEKIKVIYGGVMPETSEEHSLPKRRWGHDKARLDICFMAHKYTRRGEDKGYDVFVEAAKILRQSHDDIYFHVAGGFDQHVIDVSSLGDRIKFHGSLGPDHIDGFFKDMDIILSPNISGKLYSGSIDGFPTGCCVEAGMRGTAIFATDEFNSAKSNYIDGEDLVLVKYDVRDIVGKIEQYYNNPSALKAVGKKGVKTIRDIHSLESQMAPRITLLREAIREPAPTGEALTLRVKIAAMMSELAQRDEHTVVGTTKKRKTTLLLRGLGRLLSGRSNMTARQAYQVFRSAGLKGLRRALRSIGS